MKQDRSPRIAFTLMVVALATSATACVANLDEGCIGGLCGVDASTPAATHDGGACSNTQDAGDFPHEVALVLENCQRCHEAADRHPPTQGPFELMRYEDVKQHYGGDEIWVRMGKAVRSGLMPYSPPMLTVAEKRTLLDWLDACAPPRPEGEGCDRGEGCTL